MRFHVILLVAKANIDFSIFYLDIILASYLQHNKLNNVPRCGYADERISTLDFYSLKVCNCFLYCKIEICLKVQARVSVFFPLGWYCYTFNIPAQFDRLMMIFMFNVDST